MSVGLTHHDAMRLAVESCCSMSTVRRFLDGKNVRPSIRARLVDAANRLRLDVGATDSEAEAV
jgi:hypothetical protein